MVAGHTGTGESYLTWQLFRRPNHDWLFYPSTVPEAVGPLVIVAAAAALWLYRREASWRERLLVCWITVPVVFFELWPVKGYQYLLPIAAPLRAARGPGAVQAQHRPGTRHRLRHPAPRHGGQDRRARRRHGARRIRWAPCGARGGGVDRGERPGGVDLHDHRSVDGEPRPVLRSPHGVRAVGEPQPAQSQSVVRAVAQPRPGVARQQDPVSSSGTPSPPAARRSSRDACCVTRSATTAAPYTSKRSLPRPRRAGEPNGRRSSCTRCAREALGRSCCAARRNAHRRRARGRRRAATRHADQALRRADAGEPLLRQLLRHLPRCRRHPTRYLYAVAAPVERVALRTTVPARRSRGSGSSARRPDASNPVRARCDGWLRPGGLSPAAGARALGHGVLWRARPAVPLERRPRVRTVRPLLCCGARRQRGQPSVLAHRHRRRARRPDPGGWLRQAPDDLRPARGARYLLEVLRTGLRPAPHDRRRRAGRPQHAGGARSAPELPALRPRQEAVQPHRRSR